MEEPKTITLDKSVPEIAEAFTDCKVGDKYEVTADDEDTLTLTVVEAEPAEEVEEPEEEAAAEPAEEPADEGGYGSGNPAVDKMIKRKKKK